MKNALRTVALLLLTSTIATGAPPSPQVEPKAQLAVPKTAAPRPPLKLSPEKRSAAFRAAMQVMQKSATPVTPPSTPPPAQAEISMPNFSPSESLGMESAAGSDMRVYRDSITGAYDMSVTLRFPTVVGKLHVLDCRVETPARSLWVWRGNDAENGEAMRLEEGHALYAFTAERTSTSFRINRRYANGADRSNGWTWFGCELTRVN